MAVSAASLRWPRAQALVRAPVAVPLALGAIAAISVLVRTARFDVGYWIDEGLSIGIADRPITDIPGVLQQDGSPPAFYLLLHLWIRLTGSTGEETTHALSLLLATIAIPVAWAFARSLFGARAGWIAAVLVAANPFLTRYAQETRMYALVVLLGLVSVSCFVGAFALGRGRRWTVGFAVAHAALLWTHNWGLFLAAGLAAGWALLARLADGPERRRLVREGLLAAVVIAVLYAAWVPTFLYQARHTGAPWANPPTIGDLAHASGHLLGRLGSYVLYVGLILGGAEVLRGRARSWSPEARAAAALLVSALLTVLVPWLLSQASPAYATRYLAVALPPLLLAAALLLARAGPAGLVVLAVSAALWLTENGPHEKSNVRAAVEAVAPSLQRGDLVVVTQPEQVPVLHHYLTTEGVTGLRWATLWGTVADLGVTDWRDGVERMRRSSPARDLEPLLDRLRPGQRLLLVEPDFSVLRRWKAPWTSMVRERSYAWEDAVRNDPRFRVVNFRSAGAPSSHPNVGTLLLAREPVG